MDYVAIYCLGETEYLHSFYFDDVFKITVVIIMRNISCLFLNFKYVYSLSLIFNSKTI